MDAAQQLESLNQQITDLRVGELGRFTKPGTKKRRLSLVADLSKQSESGKPLDVVRQFVAQQMLAACETFETCESVFSRRFMQSLCVVETSGKTKRLRKKRSKQTYESVKCQSVNQSIANALDFTYLLLQSRLRGQE